MLLGPQALAHYGAWGSSIMAFNMATLLEEDEVTLMLAQHHVSEARQLLAKRAKARRRDASDIEQTLRSVETLLALIEQHLYRLRLPPAPPSVR